MPLDVDVNLRIPRMKKPATDAHGSTADNADVRFIRRVCLAALPAPGAILHVETTGETPLACEVLRADWSEGQDRFIVYCKYAKRVMPADEYHALLRDPEWERRRLL
jgi:hypothetical protein